MVEEKAKKKKSKSGQRMAKWIRYVAIAILIVVIGCYFLLKTDLLDFETVDEQLAAIEAARAIPDAENAAIIYYQLLEDYDESVFSPGFLSSEVDYLSKRQPWLSKDYPELAEWLKDQQDIISTLLLASKMEKCRFPLIIDVQQMTDQTEYLSAMRRWVFLLSRAANNDIAEGRIDAGIQKCHCIIQMGNHLCQQPVLINYMVGIAFEALALSRMKTFILEGDVSEKHLKTIEAAIPQTKDNWAEVSSKIIEFETLFDRKNVGLFDRLKFAWQDMRVEDIFDRTREIYLRLLADRRGSRILIALRRYRNKNGRWPETLDGIKDLVPAEILVDPINGGSFVYKLTEDNYTLYSKGKNNIDEDGIRKITFDPNSLEWLKTEEDDWLIWPPKSRKTKKEKADAEQQ
ncbi:MAG: hypothetical protein FVQ85_03625 [Planctomycetes bacterium]|nr:hypothetical protein [Planctomycetota bacterium]